MTQNSTIKKVRRVAYDDLHEACILKAMAIIETDGVEKLSLREVARLLGVSHQAPYKHFPSRDHILAEIVKRTFDDFGHFLDARASNAEGQLDLHGMGMAYLNYAASNPLQYRLMFGTPLPDASQHPEMMRSAQHTFALLRDCIARMALPSSVELDALYVWSTMHGLASILQTSALSSLALSDTIMSSAVQHIMARMDLGLKTTLTPKMSAGRPAAHGV